MKVFVVCSLIAFSMYFADAIEVCKLQHLLVQAIHKGILSPPVRDWMCLIYPATKYNEATIVGDKYGLFQFLAGTYCEIGRKGGLCKEDCNDFLDQDLSNDINCAAIKFKQGGGKFSYWPTWRPKCDLLNDGRDCPNYIPTN